MIMASPLITFRKMSQCHTNIFLAVIWTTQFVTKMTLHTNTCRFDRCQYMHIIAFVINYAENLLVSKPKNIQIEYHLWSHLKKLRYNLFCLLDLAAGSTTSYR